MYSKAPTDADQLAQMRYMAILQRRSAPPRCNPISILVLVMALGMLFIGLTMTVIAHWPGSTSIGENPLKIAGPVLLSVGGAFFILGMILMCFLNRKEKRKWAKSINNLAQSKLALNQSASSVPGLKGAPKNGERNDNFGASMKGSEFNGNNYPPSIEKVPPDSSDSQRYASFSYTEDGTDNGKKVGPMQGQIDTYGAVTHRQQYPTKLEDDGEYAIPDPVRTKKKKKTLDSSSENLNIEEREELLSKSATGQVKYPNYSVSDEEVFDISVEDDPNIPGAVRKKKRKKTTKSNRENLNAPEAEGLLNSSREYRKGSQVEEPRHASASRQYQEYESNADIKKSVPPPTKAKPSVPSKPAKPGPGAQQQQPSPGEARRLRVHVRTQPGATVHIQKGTATPPPSALPPVNKSTGSAVTDL